ncbi:MAG TPA: hypothetical protein VLE72_00135 [Candidatus Saccharimonadales bacterium]|nr:hypothetical protein [Candidatus Saccharimonadales bacterium]
MQHFPVSPNEVKAFLDLAKWLVLMLLPFAALVALIEQRGGDLLDYHLSRLRHRRNKRRDSRWIKSEHRRGVEEIEAVLRLESILKEY